MEWPEEADPYSTALHSLPRFGEDRLLYVDEAIRKFMADGLERADPRAKVVSAPPLITTLRERKSESEIRILRCANEVSLFYLSRMFDLLVSMGLAILSHFILSKKVNSEQLEVSAHKLRGVRISHPNFNTFNCKWGT